MNSCIISNRYNDDHTGVMIGQGILTPTGGQKQSYCWLADKKIQAVI